MNTAMAHNIIEGLQKQFQGKALDTIDEMHLDDFPLIEIPEVLSHEIGNLIDFFQLFKKIFQRKMPKSLNPFIQ